MIEDWIDSLCEVWEFDGPGFKTVRSFKLIRKREFPGSIDPKDLATQPIALTIPAAVRPLYSKGRKHLTWFGVTEFHVSPDREFDRMPDMILWYGRILRAAAAHVQLGGKVGNFVIVDSPDGIEGPLGLKYGSEKEHWGFTCKWIVEEVPTSADLPVSG